MSESVRSTTAIDQAAVSFREVVETHKRAIYYLALDLTGNHHDAEDLSQEVFIKAHRGLAGFRGDSTMYTWLRRIAVNTYLNSKRKKALTFMRFWGEDDESDDIPADIENADARAQSGTFRQCIEQALNALSPRERTAFILRHYHDLAIRDVAISMGVADGTVKGLLFRATRKLRPRLRFLRQDMDEQSPEEKTGDRQSIAGQ